MEISELKCVNPVLNTIGVNSVRLGDLQITQVLKIVFTHTLSLRDKDFYDFFYNYSFFIIYLLIKYFIILDINDNLEALLHDWFYFLSQLSLRMKYTVWGILNCHESVWKFFSNAKNLTSVEYLSTYNTFKWWPTFYNLIILPLLLPIRFMLIN